MWHYDFRQHGAFLKLLLKHKYLIFLLLVVKEKKTKFNCSVPSLFTSEEEVTHGRLQKLDISLFFLQLLQLLYPLYWCSF